MEEMKTVRTCGHWDSLHDCQCNSKTWQQPYTEWVKAAKPNLMRELKENPDG